LKNKLHLKEPLTSPIKINPTVDHYLVMSHNKIKTILLTKRLHLNYSVKIGDNKMLNMKEFVEVQLGEHSKKTSTTPVSFRCSDQEILKMDLLAKYLDFSTRSKFLSELIPVALEDVASNLPSHIGQAYLEEYEEKLFDLHEARES